MWEFREKLIFKIIILVFHVYGFVSVDHVCAVTEKRVLGSPGTVITDGCQPPCGCWDLNSGPLEDQPVLLTTEPSLQS